MWLILAACQTESPKGEVDARDSATRADSAGETGHPDSGARETGTTTPPDTGPLPEAACDGADELEVPTCALVSPGEVVAGTLDAIEEIVGYEPFPRLDEIGRDPGCPELTMDGTTEVWSGGCSTDDGRTFWGSVRIDACTERWIPCLTTFDDFVELGDDHLYETDGTYSLTWQDEGSWEVWDLRASIAGSDDPEVPDGDRAIEGTVGWMNLAERLDLHVTSDGDDWCVLADRSYWSWSDTCHETDGGAVVVGARTGRYVEHGYDDCDGCICFPPDDAEPETYCRE